MSTNRTGIALAPERARAMQEGYEEFGPTSHESDASPELREDVGEQGAIGTLPPMAKPAGKLRTKIAPESLTNLLDKLGERLAFERTGTRLYEALVRKQVATGGFSGGPSRDDLEEIRAEERSHFEMLSHVIEDLGGDPTAVTPSADVAGVAAMGIQKVIADPRTSLPQALDAILIAELTDNAAWETLIELAHKGGHDELVARFEKAHAREEQHLASVKLWLQAAQAL